MPNEIPATTKEFANWLRNIASQIDRIPDRPLYAKNGRMEIGFYYGNSVFPALPTGFRFHIDLVDTEL
jgi:hypothetical protein